MSKLVRNEISSILRVLFLCVNGLLDWSKLGPCMKSSKKSVCEKGWFWQNHNLSHFAKPSQQSQFTRSVAILQKGYSYLGIFILAVAVQQERSKNNGKRRRRWSVLLQDEAGQFLIFFYLWIKSRPISSPMYYDYFFIFKIRTWKLLPFLPLMLLMMIICRERVLRSEKTRFLLVVELGLQGTGHWLLSNCWRGLKN